MTARPPIIEGSGVDIGPVGAVASGSEATPQIFSEFKPEIFLTKVPAPVSILSAS